MRHFAKSLVTFAAAVTVGCSAAEPPSTGDDLATESATIGALQSGEVVISIDEMPNYGKEAAIARALRDSGITATIFVVGERPGEIAPREGSAYGAVRRVADVKSLLENGHLLANHTFSHPIGGAAKAPYNPAGRSYAQLLAGRADERQQALREVVWTQQLILRAISDAGGADPGLYAGQLRRWFRPSGGSWNGAASQALFDRELRRLAINDSNFAGFVSPVGWHVPVPPVRCGGAPLIRNGVINRSELACRVSEGSIVDWQCHDVYRIDPNAMPPAACADAYVNALARNGDKGVVLFHGNLDTDDYAQKTILSFVGKARARVVGGKNVRIVHPDCAIPASRKAVAANGFCS
jgi:peptidoglycan/xylan/chitin deacetylase (PgdA/CDA1 family)